MRTTPTHFFKHITPDELTRAEDEFRSRSLGCKYGPRLGTLMLAAIAKSLARTPESLPMMSVDQLWEGFKASVSQIRWIELPVGDLTDGEMFAIECGIRFDSEHLPQGECMRDIICNAMPWVDAGPGEDGLSEDELRAVVYVCQIDALMRPTQDGSLQFMFDHYHNDAYSRAVSTLSAVLSRRC